MSVNTETEVEDDILIQAFERAYSRNMPDTARKLAKQLRHRGVFGDVIFDMPTEGQDWLIDNKI